MIPEFLRPYSKCVIAGLSFAIIVAMNRWGVQNEDIQSLLIGLGRDSLLSALGTWGVYQVTNEKKGE